MNNIDWIRIFPSLELIITSPCLFSFSNKRKNENQPVEYMECIQTAKHDIWLN